MSAIMEPKVFEARDLHERAPGRIDARHALAIVARKDKRFRFWPAAALIPRGQRRKRLGVERNAARVPGLCRSGSNSQKLRREVDAAPSEPEQFAPTKPGVERNQHKTANMIEKVTALADVVMLSPLQ